MASHATVWTGILSSSATSIAVGDAVVLDSDGYFRVATTANRASYGRSRGVAKTAASGAGATFEYQVAGILGATDSNVGSGTADDWVIVNATGQLQRTATVTAGQDVVGCCPHTTGDVQLAPGVWKSTNVAGGVSVTGTGFVRATSGVVDAATSAVNLAGGATHVTGVLPLTNGGTGASSIAAGLVQSNGSVLSGLTVAAGVLTLLGAFTSANLRAALTDETGTGAAVFADTPTLVTPNIGVATGNSVSNGTASLVLDTTTYLTKTSGTVIIGQHDTTAGSSGRATETYIRGDTVHLMPSSGGGGRMKLDAVGIFLMDPTGGEWLRLAVPNLTADRTLNFPIITGTDTLVTEALAQTLTNKTVSGPSFTASSFLATSGTVSTTGDIRIANNATIRARNAANSANVQIATVDGSDNLVFGTGTNTGSAFIIGVAGLVMQTDGTAIFETVAGVDLATINASGLTVAGTAVTIGTTYATAGYIRVPNNITILAARNAANSANITIAAIDSSDRITYGGTGSIVNYYRSTVHQFQYVDGTNIASIDGNAFLTLENAAAVLRIGTNYASAGTVRLPNASGLFWRDVGNTANIAGVFVDSSNRLRLGIDGSFGSQAGSIWAFAGTDVTLGIGSTTYLTLTANTIGVQKPRIGDASAFASEGRATQAMADANQTLAAGVYSRRIIRVTGALTATRTATFPPPASEDASYEKIFVQDCTGGSVTVSTGTGTTVTVAAAGRAVLAFTPDGVMQIAT